MILMMISKMVFIIVMDLLHDSYVRYPLHDTVFHQAVHRSISWHFFSKASKGK